MSILEPCVKKIRGSRIRIRIKEFKYFNPKKLFLSYRNYDRGCSSPIQISDPDPQHLEVLKLHYLRDKSVISIQQLIQLLCGKTAVDAGAIVVTAVARSHVAAVMLADNTHSVTILCLALLPAVCSHGPDFLHEGVSGHQLLPRRP
jgi:hypothetical protein